MSKRRARADRVEARSKNRDKIRSPEQALQERFQRKERPTFNTPERGKNERFETRG